MGVSLLMGNGSPVTDKIVYCTDSPLLLLQFIFMLSFAYWLPWIPLLLN